MDLKKNLGDIGKKKRAGKFFWTGFTKKELI